MDNNFYEADIQSAPVYPVAFMIQNQEHLDANAPYEFADPQIEITKAGNIDFQLFCTIFLDETFINTFSNTDTYIYLNVLSRNKHHQDFYLNQQKGYFPTNQGKLIKYSFHVAIEKEYVEKFNLDHLKLQLSVTHKQEGEMGIAESMRIGRFLNTIIPIKR